MTPSHQAVPTLDLEDLERKARAASPVSCWVVPEGDLLTDALNKAGLGHYENYRNDAEFIAAANPETVLQLLALARSASEAKARLERLQAALEFLDHNGSSHASVGHHGPAFRGMQAQHLIEAAIEAGWNGKAGE